MDVVKHAGHKGAFAEAATRLGFDGLMTQTPPGIELAAEVITLAEALGPFPHARLDPATADAPAPHKPVPAGAEEGTGRCPAMVVPWPEADRHSSWPPSAASRSAMFRWPEPIGVWLVS
jgi:hypothetical protein